ncbi:MAG TPA: hypothetical protein VNJ31_10290 [Methyloceanibacter sp.]|nr:hypothetical protein [Methyloceanibacter sp.]
MAETPKFKIVDNPAIAESYANKLIAASFDGGAVVITLGATRFIPESSIDQPKEGAHLPVHITARIALSPGGAVELAKALNNMLKTLSELQQKQATAAAKAN